MSLLMDALKKAEKEKKEAAKKKTGEGPVLDTGEYPSGLDESGQFDHDALTNTDSHEIPVGLDTSELSLELEPLNGHTEEQAISADESVEIAMENTAEHNIAKSGQGQNLHLDDTVEGELEPGFEDTEEYQKVNAEIRPQAFSAFDDSLDEPFENTLEEQRALSDTQDDSIPFEETLDGVTASQLLQDIGQSEGQPTPVAANTVFQASKASGTAGKVKVGLVLLSVLLVVGIVGFVIHYKTTPDIPNIPSPLVAKGVEPARSSVMPDINPVTTEATTSIAHPVEAETVVETDYIRHEEQSLVKDEDWGPLYDEETLAARKEIQQTTDESSAINSTNTAAVSQAETIEEERPKIDEIAYETIEIHDGLSQEVTMLEEEVMAPVTASIAPSMIKISRIEKSKPEVSINKQAYDAYQQGNYDVASSMYQLSLEKTPDNRDALLGLAAINLRRNQTEAAYALYQRVLKLNPKDANAKVALINLQGIRNTANNESLLKLLLKDDPNSANTYFSLGNLYAKQLRWPEAQLAFFEAFTRRASNPDYAMNLAVSLDQMGQGETALKYYNKALELADSQPASFNPTSVLERIKSLTKGDNN